MDGFQTVRLIPYLTKRVEFATGIIMVQHISVWHIKLHVPHDSTKIKKIPVIHNIVCDSNNVLNMPFYDTVLS